MRTYLLAILLFSFSNSFAQQYYFLYIQTEGKQPFYVRINDKVYSSSSSGYVVLSKLSADTQNLTVGFNKDAYPEQSFKYRVHKDAGFILKNFGNSGWGLLDLQTNDVVMNGGAVQPAGTDEDSFSKTLAQVVNTPDLTEPKQVKKKEPEPPKVEERKKITTEEPEMKEQVVQTSVVNNTVKKAESSEAIPQKITISQLMSRKDESGREMIYVDGTDTIRVFIAGNFSESKNDKRQDRASKKEDQKEPAKAVIPVNVPIVKNEEEVVEEPVTVSAQPKEPVEVKEERKSVVKMVNSDCSLFASEEDFLKLRKKMASEKTDESMISAARKQYKSRCFSAEQIRNLSALFLTDEGKYKFLDASYPFVHDSESFPSLESLLTDSYYRTRFQAMIRR
jgi:hypothetical protein